MRCCAFLFAASCGSNTTAPLTEPVGYTVDAKYLKPVDRSTLRDCTITNVLKEKTAGLRLKSCGDLDYDAMPLAREVAFHCVADAIATARPFVFHEALAGMDSAIERGLVGVVRDGTLVTYALKYDSDPCGGTCPQNGGTHIDECQPLVPLDPPTTDCANGVTFCFECREPVRADGCRRGRR